MRDAADFSAVRPPRRSASALLASVVWLALAACGEANPSAASLHTPAGDDVEVVSSPDAGRAIVGSIDGSAAGATSPVAPDGAPPSGAPSCEQGALAPLAAHCAGCHALARDMPASAPDLYEFAGSEQAFVERVRTGGARMPSFAPSVIDDATLRAAYARLRSGRAPTASALPSALAPLFTASQAAPLPITFRRDDGVLVTRGAGRVRQRHELEETYGPFGPHYFEHRTFGFIIEDFTPNGESRVRVTYLPVARPTDGTNFRAFKIYGDGNVFHQNMGMNSDVALPSLALAGVESSSTYARAIAPFARAQSQQVTREPRANRPLAAGDVLEFEFGVFIDPAAVRSGTRTSYYSDSFRYRVGTGGLTPESRDPSGQLGPTAVALLGGDTTSAWLYAEPETYYTQMATNIQHEHVQPFVEGRRLFHTRFDDGKHSEPGNPPLPEQAGKLGPQFVAASCSSCHPGNGGGRPLTAQLDAQSSLVFKLYDAPALGGQLQLAEGGARPSGIEERRVTLSDGESVLLRRTRYELAVAGASSVRFSPRIARRLVGLGLLEAIDESALLARADPLDCDGDGISGRALLVTEPNSELRRLGRFGWKAEKVSVEHQVADALAADLGVETRLFPGPSGRTELTEAELAALTTYMRLLAVPPQRTLDEVERGRLAFASVGCASCHAPLLETAAAHPFVELRGQTVRPYSDLLLHDMGAELADESGAPGDQSEGERASASEWRTPPLWGIGLSRTVQGYVALLHDGRAASVLEAVLWHGGEAAGAKQRFSELSREERAALLKFVESL